MQKQVKGVSNEVVQILQEYDWPGNVRELKNVIQRAIIVCENEEINLLHLPPRFRNMGNIKHIKNTVTFEIGTSLEQVEKEMILKALSVSNNNRTHAAGQFIIS
jgi:two-component system response regulator HydG